MKPTTDLSFKIPGKTFLAGEYAVLLGGSALGLATSPCFEFTVNRNSASSKNYGSNTDNASSQDNAVFSDTVFHADSPAGKYLTRHSSSSSIQFRDPYSAMDVRGGFGRSTAEYLAVITPALLQKKTSVFDILQDYKNLHADQKIKPSGIDLVFQCLGGVTSVDQQLQLFQNFEWNFLNLDFCLIYSGIKVPTHEHLASLDLNKLSELPKLSAMLCSLYSKNNEAEFLYQMGQWCELLKSKNLTHPHSLEIRQLLESTGVIKLVKPCGALGADVLIAFFDRVDRKQVRQLLFEKNYKVVAGADDLEAGLISQLRPYWSQNVG